jgi:predicted DNA-binding transcriptional regulator YafY
MVEGTTMRAGRLLSILLLLQRHRRLTARDLADRLEVSERTILRDMDALSAAGVPVYAQRGAGGGWLLPDDYRADIAGLSDAEVQALLAAQSPRLLADLGIDLAARDAALKLLATVAPGRDGVALAERIHVDVPSWRRATEPVPFLPLLQRALSDDRQVHMTYRRADGSCNQRVVGPLGLVAKGHLWYLVALRDDEVRTYRVSRIDGLELLDTRVTRPARFDLAAWWSDSQADFLTRLPRYPVVLRVTQDVLHQLERPGGWVQVQSTSTPDVNGWVRLELLFETQEDASRYVLMFGDRASVLEPDDLRLHVIALAQAVLRAY